MSLVSNDQLLSAQITDKLVAVLVSQALRQEHAATDAVVKRIARATQASPTTVRKWYEGLNAPSSANLLTLMGTYEGVLHTMLHIAGRGEIIDPQSKELESSLNTLRQVFYGDRFVTLNVVVDAKIASSLNQRQLWFLGEIQQDRSVRVEDLMKVWGICLRTARRDLKGLTRSQIVKFSGGKRNGKYRLV
jgi:DeoR-like helix-turn-helix domain